MKRFEWNQQYNPVLVRGRMVNNRPVFVSAAVGNTLVDDYYCCLFKDKECAAECVATHGD